MNSEDWSKHWEICYGSPSWNVWVKMLDKGYGKLLEGVSLKNPRIIELGAGSGVNSISLSKILKSKSITLVDFNKRAAEISRKLAVDPSVEVRHVNKNVLDLKTGGKFDIVHSEGLIEHFYGKDRMAVLKKHIDCCRKGGYIIIFVPRKSVQYSIFRWLVTKLGRWIWDEEPLSVKEMHEMCGQLGQKIIKVYKPLFMYQAGFLIRKE